MTRSWPNTYCVGKISQTGGSALAYQLTLDTPYLLPELHRRIAAIEAMEGLLGLEVENASLGASPVAFSLSERLPVSDEPTLSRDILPTIANYEISKIIGFGGMGVVYLARHLALNRLVALKMIGGTANTSPDQKARFLNEAKLVAQLNHPNIVPIYEIGEDEGVPFFAMEYVAGDTLAKKLAGSALMDSLSSASLVKTLATAMDHAHKRGILHRDLKPGNILLGSTEGIVPSTETIIPKITDFGLGRLVDPPTSQTLTGAILGTPSYMAPEQASGQTSKIGVTTDVYALGAILYECLSGVPPFRGPTVFDTLIRVRTQEPVSLNGVPRDLEIICLKCLEKQPAKRYATAGALADDLQRYLDGKPILARPISSLEKARKWVWRKPTLAALISVSFLSVVALAAILISYSAVLKTERDDAINAKKYAEKERDRADEQHRRAQELVRHSIDLLCRTTNDIDAGRQSKEYEGTAVALFFAMACAYADIADGYAHDTKMAVEDRKASRGGL